MSIDGRTKMEIKTIEQAEDYLEEHIKLSTTLRNPDDLRQHSAMVSEILEEKTIKIGKNYSNFLVDPVEMAIAGYLHDIGRTIAKGSTEQEFHSIVGSEYLEKEGLERIAVISYAHTLGPELAELKNFRNLTFQELLPKYWQQILVTLVDCSVDGQGNHIGMEKRLNDMGVRYGDKPEGQALKKAIPRIKEMDFLIISMLNKEYQGNFSEWGFL